MSQKSAFFIRSEGGCHFFGIKLDRIALLTALPQFGERYYLDLVKRQAEWLSVLLGSGGEESTYDLRIISYPNSANLTEGIIQIALLCKVRVPTQASALENANQILRLSRTLFEDEYEFVPVTTEADLDRLRKPFEIADAVQVFRRSEIVPIDLPFGGRERTVGFKSEVAQFKKAENRIYHVYPFVPTNSAINSLAKFLLWQDSRLAISFRVVPTSLTDSESDLLVNEISRCEHYATLRAEHDESNSEYSRQEQARSFQVMLTRSLGVLKNRAALMQIEIASDAPLPQTVIDFIGAHITLPSGQSAERQDQSAFLSGGYALNRIRETSLACVERSWGDLTFTLEADERVPGPAVRLRHLYDTNEAAAAFRFPTPTNEDVPGIKCKSSRTLLFAGNGVKGQLIGHSRHNSHSKEVRLSRSDRRRHLYAVGQTGTGKSTMFESMILDDMRNGEGTCVIDPHGDLIEKILTKVPANRAKDVIIFDPGDTDRPLGFNILEYEDEAEKNFLIQELLAIIDSIIPDKSMTGPVFFLHSKMILRLVMSDPHRMGTLAQFYKVFSTDRFYRRFLPLPTPDSLLQAFIDFTLSQERYTHISSDGSSMGGYVACKYEPFIGDPMLRNIFGQPISTINLKDIMDNGKILLVNLSKGRMGELNARFFGMVLIAKIQAAVMSRANVPENERRDFYLYVDEFQNLATQNFSVLLAESRKYRLNLVLTNQFVTQVPKEIADAITGNVGTTIAFRVGSSDAELLEQDFLPSFNRFDLMNLPNFNAYVSTLIDGEVSKAFSMRIISDTTEEDPALAKEIRRNARLKYGVRRDLVERVIENSLKDEVESDNDLLSKYQFEDISVRLDISIEHLDVSAKTYQRLIDSGFVTVKDIINLGREDLIKRASLGEDSIDEIDRIVAEMGLSFGSSPDDFGSLDLITNSDVLNCQDDPIVEQVGH